MAGIADDDTRKLTDSEAHVLALRFNVVPEPLTRDELIAAINAAAKAEARAFLEKARGWPPRSPA